MWRISSGDGFVQVEDDGTWHADPETTEVLNREAGKPVLSLAGTYRPTGGDDPVWLHAMALAVLPAPRTVTGEPPRIPPVDAAFPADAVF